MIDELDRVDYDALDPGIRETVRLLRSYGFETIDSGDGHSKGPEAIEAGDASDTPHVFIDVEPNELAAEARTVCGVLQSHGLVVVANCMGESGKVEIHASYDPVTGTAVIGVIGLHDGMLTP